MALRLDRFDSRPRSAFSPRFEMTAIALVGSVILVVAIPVVLQERANDWRAYATAARSLETGAPLYPWVANPDIRAITSSPYLYPPLFAALWTLGFGAVSFAALKVLLLAASAVDVARSEWRGALAVGAFVIAALTFPPTVHDLILGNVMSLYLAATLLSLARRGWLGAIGIGLCCALILKPMVGPYLVGMLIARPADFVRVAIVAFGVTVLGLVIVGPGPYLDYIGALPHMTSLGAPFSGNEGLSSVSPIAAAVGVVVAYVWAVASQLALPARSGIVVALAMTQLAQPTIGFNYAVMLLPAIVLLWQQDRRGGLIVGLLAAAIMLASPVGAAVLLAAGASVLGRWPRTPPAEGSHSLD